jgi:hypothetical protein
VSISGNNTPQPIERGYKDTVIADPGEVTRVCSKIVAPRLLMPHATSSSMNGAVVLCRTVQVTFSLWNEGGLDMKTQKILTIVVAVLMGIVIFLGCQLPATYAQIPGGTLDPASIPKYVNPLIIPPVMPQADIKGQHGDGFVD